MKNPLSAPLLASLSTIALIAPVNAAHAADGPPKLELHLWGGNAAAGSSQIGLRSGEVAAWLTRRDRFSVAYDDSLSLDNPALARDGVNAEAWSVGYLHDFSGRYLTSGAVGRRNLSNGATQDIYKFELVRLRDDRVAKIGVQINPTSGPAGKYTDGVAYGTLNFPITRQWRFEPALFLGRTGEAGDTEWRFATYTEFNARNGTQLGFGVSGGVVRSSLVGESGGVVAAHARLSWPLIGNHLVHLQLRHERSPADSYTLGLLGVTLRLDR
jgi:hypothetical protein